MTTAFADSFYFFALGNERDPAHVKAVEFLQNHTGKLITTGWILTEVADGWSKLNWRAKFEVLLSELSSNPNVRLIPFTGALFEAGIALFKDRPDKEWSLTDGISFVVMEREGLRESQTGDHHFEQAGFTALLK